MALIVDASALYAQADASLIVLAHRFDTNRVLTLDERGFRAVTPLGGGSFTVLPADLPEPGGRQR